MLARAVVQPPLSGPAYRGIQFEPFECRRMLTGTISGTVYQDLVGNAATAHPADESARPQPPQSNCMWTPTVMAFSTLAMRWPQMPTLA